MNWLDRDYSADAAQRLPRVAAISMSLASFTRGWITLPATGIVPGGVRR